MTGAPKRDLILNRLLEAVDRVAAEYRTNTLTTRTVQQLVEAARKVRLKHLQQTGEDARD